MGKRGVAQGKVYYTFISPEAKEELKKYLEERKRTGEKLTPESPLIRDAYHTGKSITVEGFEKVWARLLRRAGLAEKSNRGISSISTLCASFPKQLSRRRPIFQGTLDGS